MVVVSFLFSHYLTRSKHVPHHFTSWCLPWQGRTTISAHSCRQLPDRSGADFFLHFFMVLLPPKKGVWPCLRTKKKKQAKSVEIFHGRDQCKISRPLNFSDFLHGRDLPDKKKFLLFTLSKSLCFSLCLFFLHFLFSSLYFLLFWLLLDKLNRLSSSVNSTELLFMCMHGNQYHM